MQKKVASQRLNEGMKDAQDKKDVENNGHGITHLFMKRFANSIFTNTHDVTLEVIFTK